MHIGIALEDRVEQIEVPEEEILRFPKGIVGFEELTHFALFQLESPLYLLQSVDDPHAGFVALDPFLLDPSYRVPAQEECGLLELETDDRRSALCIATLSDDGQPKSINLRAPIVLNASKKLGMQVILQEDRDVRSSVALSQDGSLVLVHNNDGIQHGTARSAASATPRRGS